MSTGELSSATGVGVSSPSGSCAGVGVVWATSVAASVAGGATNSGGAVGAGREVDTGKFGLSVASVAGCTHALSSNAHPIINRGIAVLISLFRSIEAVNQSERLPFIVSADAGKCKRPKRAIVLLEIGVGILVSLSILLSSQVLFSVYICHISVVCY